jgi:hypothetical protein
MSWVDIRGRGVVVVFWRSCDSFEKSEDDDSKQ